MISDIEYSEQTYHKLFVENGVDSFIPSTKMAFQSIMIEKFYNTDNMYNYPLIKESCLELYNSIRKFVKNVSNSYS